VKSQALGNIFSSYAYDGVINIRMKDEDILKDRDQNEYQLRLFELGVNPTLVFEKNNTDKKQIIMQISDIKDVDKPIPSIGEDFEEKIRFIANPGNDFRNLFIFYKKHTINKCFFDENNGNYSIKSNTLLKDLKQIFTRITSCKLIIRYMPKSNILLITGFYNGNLFLINVDNSKINYNDINIIKKMNQEDQVLLKNYGNGIITSLEISKDEKYIAFGNDKGTLVILENLGKNSFKILDIISSHTGYIIKSISINTDLNLIADCSYDNFIHIYTLPKCVKINSIFIKNFNSSFLG
jgi:WD40 repeat protein